MTQIANNQGANEFFSEMDAQRIHQRSAEFGESPRQKDDIDQQVKNLVRFKEFRKAGSTARSGPTSPSHRSARSSPRQAEDPIGNLYKQNRAKRLYPQDMLEQWVKAKQRKSAARKAKGRREQPPKFTGYQDGVLSSESDDKDAMAAGICEKGDLAKLMG